MMKYWELLVFQTVTSHFVVAFTLTHLCTNAKLMKVCEWDLLDQEDGATSACEGQLLMCGQL
jgi:hypothetical protein